MKIPTWLAAAAFVCGVAVGAAPELRIELGGGLAMELVLICAGQYQQGSPESEPGRNADETLRAVTLSSDFYIGRSAVTRGQWQRFVAETGYRSEAETGTSGGYGWDGQSLVQRKSFTWRNPGFPQTDGHPVCMVTFPDAQAFCKWLERKAQRRATLPTEAQWEYACRASTTTPWHGGSTAEGVAWHQGNAGNGTRPVDALPPNPWGLFIAGNVAEWCLDWYAPYQEGPVTNPLQENPNLSEKPRRVLRGGSWLRDAKNTRSASRFRADPRSRNADIGFRVVCAAEGMVPAAKPTPVPQMETQGVEAEPGQQVSEPLMPQNDHPPIVHAPSWGLRGLLCLLFPIGLVVLFVRLVGRSQRSKNPFVVPPQPARPPRPPALSARSATIRKTGDGFWLSGGWTAGTLLKVRYVAGGRASEIELVYQPGPEGQFVFTGAIPDSVSVVAADEDDDEELPPPLPTMPPPHTSHRDDDRGSPPPLFPPAY
jgi:formylglycine-generating enzyme required for sulfatase activity